MGKNMMGVVKITWQWLGVVGRGLGMGKDIIGAGRGVEEWFGTGKGRGTGKGNKGRVGRPFFKGETTTSRYAVLQSRAMPVAT